MGAKLGVWVQKAGGSDRGPGRASRQNGEGAVKRLADSRDQGLLGRSEGVGGVSASALVHGLAGLRSAMFETLGSEASEKSNFVEFL
ncbi:hypothetical protein AK812_SmicGene24699 [Symbiodinium microadriaticum]|uniref:Uncharacterized protein n=1 Tax=Symbiodinium microadriaticum TaxID=2951 RepID=A0A1Q9DE03_SYMMI|nr:hypothetical protein AK812_SmicGene24699 [Symbiodinium microadriaticum]